MSEEPVVVRSSRLPEVKMAYLVTEDEQRIFYRRPPPPPARTLRNNYETRLYDTPRPIDEHYAKTEDRRPETDQIYRERKFGRDDGAPSSPRFDARDMRFDEKEPIYSTLGKSTSLDGVGQNFSEHRKSTERIPGGTKHSEYTMKSESYQSHPKTEFFKAEMRQEARSPFATSTSTKVDRPESPRPTSDAAKAPTPDYDRISPPYGKEVRCYGGPNFFEETTTEVKDVPNGTQKITTTKIYSSSPVNLTTTSTKYEPVRLEGIDELAKAFDDESKYGTLDSRFDTLESKMSSDTSRSFVRPSEFRAAEAKEIDGVDGKFSKRTVSSEIVEKKSVMTSSRRSESSSTVTKKFGNF